MSVPSRRQFLSLLVPLLTGPAAAAWALSTPQHFDLQIITADQSNSTAVILEALRLRFPTATVANQPNKRKAGNKAPVYLTIGPEALRTLISSGAQGPIISCFTSYKVFHGILDKAQRSGPISAVYADPSPAQQFQLISLIYRKPIKVGVILGSDNENMEAVLRRHVNARQAEVTYETLGPGEDINRALTRLADVQAILATPDSTVYNAETIRTILVSTYRRNQALIGFSSAIVKAGALATTFSGVDDVVSQIEEMLTEFDATGHLPDPQFPKYFDVTTNDDVARSLNIVISDPVTKFSRKAGAKP